VRIVYWNIRAGGGKRMPWIAAQLYRWRPDVVGLCEFRATPPSQTLALLLAERGLCFQRQAVSAEHPPTNGTLLASRRPLRRVALRAPPPEPTRWLLARIVGGPCIGVLHAPNFVSGRKRPFLDAITALAARWRSGPAIFGGDTNTGIPPRDGNPAAFHQWETEWIPTLDAMGWADAFRRVHGQRETHTWYSPNAGNGYRLDQAFVNRALLPTLVRFRYAWGSHRDAPQRRDALSDHAAMIIDLALDRLNAPQPATPGTTPTPSSGMTARPALNCGGQG